MSSVKNYDSLVFEGGGVLGMCYLSAIEEAVRLKLISFPPADETLFASAREYVFEDDPDAIVSAQEPAPTSTIGRFVDDPSKPVEAHAYRFAGTSIGAAFAALLACRATPEFLRAEFSTWDPIAVAHDSSSHANWFSESNFFLRWLRMPLQLIRDASRFYKTGGLLQGHELEEKMAEVVERQTGDRNITLMDVHRRYQTDLKIVAVDINRHALSILSFRNEPDMPLVKAVMASMAVPVVFPWVQYRTSAYVDGGVLCNFFIDAFDSRNAETGERDAEHIYSGTLGFKSYTKRQNIDLNKQPLPHVTNVFQSLPRILNSVIDTLHREHQSQVDFDRTIRINVHELQAFDFEMTPEKRALMDEYGVDGVRRFCASKTV
jgi:predicted acylesterase/phospholipase RssA